MFQPRRRDQRFCSSPCRIRGYAQVQQAEAIEGAEAARKLADLLDRVATRWAYLAEGRRG